MKKITMNAGVRICSLTLLPIIRGCRAPGIRQRSGDANPFAASLVNDAAPKRRGGLDLSE